MNKSLEAFRDILGILSAVSGCEVDMDSEIIQTVKKELERLELIDNANPSEAIECVNELDRCLISDMSIEIGDYDESNYCMSYEYIDFNGEGLQFNDDIKEETIIEFIRKKKISTIKQALLKAQENEKENELLKEIIKSLFDRGCPLHQYVDKDFGLTIEVDSECSIMHLGEYKGVDLDKKLKEVLGE